MVAWVTYLRKLWAKSRTFDAETSMPVLSVLRQKYMLPENRRDQILIGFSRTRYLLISTVMPTPTLYLFAGSVKMVSNVTKMDHRIILRTIGRYVGFGDLLI